MALMASLSWLLSSPSIRREIPPARGLLGIKTRYRPARLTNEVSAAPLLPRSSLSTWTITSWPSRTTSLMLGRPDCSRDPLAKYWREISLSGKNPCLSAPNSTKAASKLGSTRVILPLYMLAFFCSLVRCSMSRSKSRCPSTRATRTSSA